MAPDVRAAKGVFLAFQYPVEIPGVATMTFLRTALNAQRKARGESEYSTPDFLKKVREVAKSLNIPQDMLRRGVNVGFSGGEKKRNEILQMALFEPAVCILDEMDSASTSTRSAWRPMASTRCVRRIVRWWSSPTTSGCSTTLCLISCT
jgi:Fe-S cluster assembly ATP-binding protein